jgi:hypothetical protein
MSRDVEIQVDEQVKIDDLKGYKTHPGKNVQKPISLPLDLEERINKVISGNCLLFALYSKRSTEIKKNEPFNCIKMPTCQI